MKLSLSGRKNECGGFSLIFITLLEVFQIHEIRRFLLPLRFKLSSTLKTRGKDIRGHSSPAFHPAKNPGCNEPENPESLDPCLSLIL